MTREFSANPKRCPECKCPVVNGECIRAACVGPEVDEA